MNNAKGEDLSESVVTYGLTEWVNFFFFVHYLFLFKHSAFLDIEERSGSTSVDLAQQYNKEEAVLLLEH